MAKNESVIFQDNRIRRICIDEQWYFSVMDFISVLTGSDKPKDQLRKMRRRDPELRGYIRRECPRLQMPAPSGKNRRVLAGTEQTLFRIAQSAVSPEAESIKEWLAETGYQRLRDMENPELAQQRIKELYEAKGYHGNWIDMRMRGISVRQTLTEEWQRGGVEAGQDFAALTHEIALAIFGITPTEHRQLKGLTKKGQNLRDHMTDLELIFTMLGEQIAVELSRRENPDTLEKNLNVARIGGSAAGKARQETERVLGRSVVSARNFLDRNPESLIEETIFGRSGRTKNKGPEA